MKREHYRNNEIRAVAAFLDRCRFGVLVVCILAVVLAAPASAWAYSYFWSVLDAKSGMPIDRIDTVSVDPGGYVWVSGDSADNGTGRLAVVDPMQEITGMSDELGRLAGVKANAVGFEPVAEEKIADLESGGIWIATDHGIDVVHRNGVVTNINAGNSGLSGNRVTSLSVNAANTKWIAVWGRGVSCVDAEFNWQRYTRDDGLCSNYIISMQEDGHGNIWFGSKGRGVSCLSAEGEWTRFSSANSGLIGNRVNAIVVEPPGKVWFATPEGVSV
ncbi:MAG: hypothetical protein GY868_14680, partial [Deltaproteobacteria bacterium]|nr:hypothetical protein [Deltaproteobacteria bacterium]